MKHENTAGNATRLRLLEVISAGRSSPPDGPAPRWIPARVDDPSLQCERVSIVTEGSERCPILLVRRSDLHGPLRPIFVLHGTFGSMSTKPVWNIMRRYAKRGALAVGVDSRHHGERVPDGTVDQRAYYMEALVEAWRQPVEAGIRQQTPFIYDTVWDLMRVLDWLETRVDVDCSRVGATGMSLGGMQSWLWQSADVRVYAGAPAIGVQSFRWAIEHEAWHARAASVAGLFAAAVSDLGRPLDKEVVRMVFEKITPGLLQEFDAEWSLASISPRPILVASNAADPRCPIRGLRAAVEAASRQSSVAFLSMFVDTSVANDMLPSEDWMRGHVITDEMWLQIDQFLCGHILGGANL